jgi:hypothetical protein
MKTKQFLTLPFGLIFLATAILIEKFGPDNNLLDFMAGFLFGLSIVLNMKYIYTRSRKTVSI